jgi:phenylacetic acid degradation protein
MAKVYAIDGVVPVIDPAAFVHPTAVLTGDVIVSAGCYVGPCASLRGDFSRLILRAGANLQDNCIMHGFPGSDTVVEEGGHIGHGAILHGCTIKRNALVGMNAVVMDCGLPAKLVRPLTEAELAWKIEATAEYHELARRSLASVVEAAPAQRSGGEPPACRWRRRNPAPPREEAIRSAAYRHRLGAPRRSQGVLNRRSL